MDVSETLHQPKYVLRGHTSAIHALAISPDNSRILTGDADGWIVSWILAYKRPLAVWRAHDNSVLGLSWWGSEAMISHGRDSKLVAWQLSRETEGSLDKALPADQDANAKKKPTIIHELTVNTMNFCSFASCLDPLSSSVPSGSSGGGKALLLAVPHTLDSEAIDIFQLPSTDRLSTIPVPKFIKSGMAMALHLRATAETTCVVAGYESGHIAYYRNSTRKAGTGNDESRTPVFNEEWHCIYLARPHSQPVLSLGVSLDGKYLASIGADSVVSVHLLKFLIIERLEQETIEGAHAVEQPYQLLKTGHPGQQGLSVSGDGALFATAGWDGIVRIYQWDPLKEISVLEWHRDGVYATAFASKLAHDGSVESQQTYEGEKDVHARAEGESSTGTARVNQTVSRRTPHQGALAVRRERQAQQTSWLAVGGKDSKVSLWEKDWW